MKIVLGVSGSISAYKSYDILRGLIKNGHEVKVVTTSSGEKFTHPWLFKSLGAAQSYSSKADFELAGTTEGVLHINLARWCDALVIAPGSANLISNFATGQATDLLTSIYLAMGDEKPTLIYPAMNTKMLTHPAVQKNIETLNNFSNTSLSSTADGTLACGEIGEGKLLEVDTIVELAPIQLNKMKATDSDKHYVVTTGATVSPLDPVRYITNPSSGLTGYEIAKEILAQGHRVTIVAGKYSDKRIDNLKLLKGCEVLRVTDTNHLAETVDSLFKNGVDVYISAAAIGDIEFDYAGRKLKKEDIQTSLPIKKAKDVLASTISSYGDKCKIVGFAAETQLTDEVLKKKWDKKPVDLLIGTRVDGGFLSGNKKAGFSEGQAEYKFWDKSGKVWEGSLSKQDLAKDIIERIN